jgi:membrane-associated phospholipid phosphatase
VALLGSGVVSALAFLVLASIAGASQPIAIDRAIAAWARHLESPVMDLTMRAMTFAGSFAAIAAFIASIALWMVRRGRWKLAVLLAGTASLAEGLNVLLKLFFQRARPEVAFGIPIPASYSFPSGHAMVSVAAYGLATMVVITLRPRLRACLIVAAPLWILLIGFSRVYLGVHWATDVLAGFAAGSLLLLAGGLAARRLSRNHNLAAGTPDQRAG